MRYSIEPRDIERLDSAKKSTTDAIKIAEGTRYLIGKKIAD